MKNPRTPRDLTIATAATDPKPLHIVDRLWNLVESQIYEHPTLGCAQLKMTFFEAAKAFDAEITEYLRKLGTTREAYDALTDELEAWSPDLKFEPLRQLRLTFELLAARN